MSTLQTTNLKHPDAAGNQIAFASDGSSAVSGDVNFDSGTVYVDSANSRLGVGTSSPGVLLDVAGSNPTLRVKATTANTEVSTIRFTEDNNYVGGFLKYDGSTNLTHIGTHSAADSDAANDNNAITIERDTRNVGIGSVSPDSRLHIADTKSTPISATSTDTNRLVLDDASGSTSADSGFSVDFEGVYGGLGRIAILKQNGATSGTSRDFGEFKLFLNSNVAESSYPAFQECLRIDPSAGFVYSYRGDEQFRVDDVGRLLLGTSSASGDALLQVNGPLQVQNVKIAQHSRSYTASTSATDLFKVRMTSGHGAAELTWMFVDSNYANGVRVGKIYLAFTGSGSNITAVSIASSTETSRTNGTVTGISWSASVHDVNHIKLTATGTTSSSGAGTIYIFGSSPFFDGLTPISDV